MSVEQGQDQSAQDTVNQVGQEITRRNLDIQPTLTIRPGSPVRVVAQHDLIMPLYGAANFVEVTR